MVPKGKSIAAYRVSSSDYYTSRWSTFGGLGHIDTALSG